MKKKIIAVIAVLLVALLLLTACGSEITIGDNGNWYIDGEDSGVSAQGPKGDQGIQGEQGDKGDKGDTGPKGDKGDPGTPGSNGEDADIPYIGDNGHWWVGETDLGVTAMQGPKGEQGEEGPQGEQGEVGPAGENPHIGENGHWWVGEVDTGVRASERNMDRVGTDGLLFRTTIRGGVAGYEVYSYEGTDTDIVVPNYIFEQPVISIVQDALPTKITSVSVSSNTRYLPEFEDYTNLVSFDFNNCPVETTTVNMFYDCTSLEKVENYDNIKVLADNSFRNTKIADFDFSHVVSIGNYAFYDCNITNYDLKRVAPKFVYLPPNVLKVGNYAFESDFAVYFSGASCVYTSERLVKNVKHNDEGWFYVDDGASVSIVNYDGQQKKVAIPSVIDEKPVTALVDFAFWTNPYVERVEIPHSVTKIGTSTFFLCKNLYGVFVPNSVETCGEFYESFNAYPAHGFEITEVFFEATSIDYTGGVTSPSDLRLTRYMVGVKPEQVVEDESCVYINNGDNYDVVTIRNVEGKVTIPAEVNQVPVKRINSYALYGNTLTQFVEISSGIQKISTNAFYSGGNLKVVNIPATVDAVNYNGFSVSSSCILCLEAESVPVDWDNSWCHGSADVRLGSHMNIDSTETYAYEITDGNLWLVKYLHHITTKTPVVVPSSVDGMEVYGVRSYCYRSSVENGSYNRHVFVVPATITVMEQDAINLYRYGYCDYFMYFESKSQIPETWDSYWYRSQSGYTSDAKFYYAAEWEMVDGVPTPKTV